MIIDSDYQTLTIKTFDNKILIRNIDEYNLLKYKDFNGERIKKTFKDGTKVEETFNDGIFNISHKDIKMQLRNKIEVSKRLKYCIDNDTTQPIKDLLLDNIESEIKDDLLYHWLVPFIQRVQVNKTEIIIDEYFKVDMNGAAHYKQGNKWHFLCIVASEAGKINRFIKHDLGSINIDFKTMEIYTKVLFLLFPNLKDSIFMNQLPDKLRKEVEKKLSDY